MIDCKMGMCTFNDHYKCVKQGITKGGNYNEDYSCTCKEYREVCNWTGCKHNGTIEGRNFCKNNHVDPSNCPSVEATLEEMIESGQMVIEDGEYIYKG